MPLTPKGFQWEAPGRVVAVIGGDSFVCDLDLGWFVSIRTIVKVEGLLIPANSSAELKAAKYAKKLLPPDAAVIVKCKKVSRISRTCWADVTYGPGFAPRSEEGSFVAAMLAAGVATKGQA